MGFCYFAISHHICNCYPFRERRVFLFFPKENHHEQNRRCGNCCKRQQFRPTSTIRTHKPRIYHLWPYGHPRPRKWQKRHCPHRQGNCGTNFRIDRRPWSHPQRPSQKHANERVGFARNVYAFFGGKLTAQSPTFSSVKDFPSMYVATNAILFATMQSIIAHF